MLDYQEVIVTGLTHRVCVLNPSAPGVPTVLRNGVGVRDGVLEHIAMHLPGRPIIIVQAPNLCLPLPTKMYFLAAAVFKAGFREVDVVGVSYGGTEAQQWSMLTMPLRAFGALGMPMPFAQVRRMALISTSPNAFPGTPKALVSLGLVSWFPQLHETLAPAIHGDLGEETDASWLLGQRSSPWQVMSNVLSLSFWSSVPFLRLVNLPAIILHGGTDQVVPARNARLMAWLLPDAGLHLWPDQGHALALTHSTEVFAKILAHFNS